MSVLLNLYSEMNLQPLGNRIGSEMVCMITSNAVNRVFEPRQVKTKDNKIGICCFFAKYTDLMSCIKDWLIRNLDNMSK
jgi:hypothetical protein